MIGWIVIKQGLYILYHMYDYTKNHIYTDHIHWIWFVAISLHTVQHSMSEQYKFLLQFDYLT